MNNAVQEQTGRRGAGRTCGFAGHLRVRPAAAAEAQHLAGLFRDAERASWVAETSSAEGTLALVAERFARTEWKSAGITVTAADGETVLALYPDERCRGLAHEVLRAAVRVLREEPFTELSACVGEDDARAARVFEKAGFAPAGPCRFLGRPSTRFIRTLRGDCTPYNVWI